MIQVRVDDFPNTKGEPQHSLDAFREFHRCLSECTGGKRYLLGVIPGRCDTDSFSLLKNEIDCSIGMHGMQHDEKRLDHIGTEFMPWMTVADKTEYLLLHKKRLEHHTARQISVYMPPRNAVKPGDVEAFTNAGFSWFTGGPETTAPFKQSPIAIISNPPHEYGRTDEMFAADSHIVLRQLIPNVTLTLHWTWETNIGLQHMKKFFAEIPDSCFCDFND